MIFILQAVGCEPTFLLLYIMNDMILVPIRKFIVSGSLPFRARIDEGVEADFLISFTFRHMKSIQGYCWPSFEESI